MRRPAHANMPRSPVSSPPVTLAKFSRPRLYNVQKRERLFRLLDERRSHPIIWIAGPPGSGKSTLIASYIDARKIPGMWFQADPGDADPATLTSNRIWIEWPHGSGNRIEVPEVDRCVWFAPAEAREKINPAQVAFIDRLEVALAEPPEKV